MNTIIFNCIILIKCVYKDIPIHLMNGLLCVTNVKYKIILNINV